MKLINTTNSHSQLVKSQLESTDATLVEVYSAGNTDVIFTQAPLHYEILISNKHRAIREPEIETIQEFFLKRKIDKLSEVSPDVAANDHIFDEENAKWNRGEYHD